MKSLFEKNGSTYTKAGDYYLPNLGAPNVNYKIGRYGRARRQYLKEHKKGEYTALMISGKLHKHLHDVDIKAQKIMVALSKMRRKLHPIRLSHQRRVGHMNNARNSAEEVINQKLIYAIR